MTYAVKEMFLTLQGEGVHTGRVTVLIRFAGCNLWAGTEQTRARAICRFCDTDFVGTDGEGGGRFVEAEVLAASARAIWDAGRADLSGRPYAVCTGGEPLLQLDGGLVAALHASGFEVGVETNGTIAVPEGLDWICVSPKANAELQQTSGDELKLVYPQSDCPPERFEHLAFDHFSLQPLDGPDRDLATRSAVEYCLSHRRWRLSVQTHKTLGLR